MVPLPPPSQRRRRDFLQPHSGPLEWDDDRHHRDHHDHHATLDERDPEPDSILMATFPIHPLPDMQAPFEESMLDATGDNGHVPYTHTKKSVKTRQHALCRDDEATELLWNFTYNCHWRLHPTDKFHPLRKTVAQIVFGVHLLHQHLERSVADVADILLKHVNELDCFLQQAGEDLESSLKDMAFRHKCLKVPMEHVNEFDRLLEDPAYRAQLLDGNIVIERTIGRMSEMLNDYLIDINTFQEANQELDLYLLEIGDGWTAANEDVGRIYSAMCGNTGGWSQFLQSIVVKAERLGVVLVQVSSYCNEIEKRCGAASRRSMLATRTSSRNSSKSRENARGVRSSPSGKPLPTTPNDRPPFMTPVSNGNESQSDVQSIQQSHLSRSKIRNSSSITNTSDSVGTPKHSDETNSTSATSNLELNVRPQRDSKQPEYFHEAWHNDTQGGSPTLSRNPSRASRLFSHRRKQSADGKVGTEEKKSGLKRLSTRLDSSSINGNDSAYSSLSSSSFSPKLTSPRSGSSMSMRQNGQFGLFPSRSATMPINDSSSARLGAISPASGPILRSVRSDVTPSMTRPSTGMSTVSNASGKKLSKRSSLQSIRRLFTKKQVKEITPIAE